MIRSRPADDRGHVRLSWLDSRHTFSFGHYHDPQHMRHSVLRVINQDRVSPGTGFAAHSHDNMEILSYVRHGAITHRDSMGNEARLSAGEFQLMSAGTGITHSEHNREHALLEFLQIWIYPNEKNSEPGYQQQRFPVTPGLQLVVSPDGENGSLRIRQQAWIHHGRLAAGATLTHSLRQANGWLQMVDGALTLNDTPLFAGDGAALSDEAKLTLRAERDSEFLLFDLP